MTNDTFAGGRYIYPGGGGGGKRDGGGRRIPGTMRGDLLSGGKPHPRSYQTKEQQP
jgi:hypothetical protein